MPSSPAGDIEALFRGGILVPPLGDKTSSMAFFRAVAETCGATTPFGLPGQAELMSQLSESDHLVVVLVDGMGMNLRPTWPSGGFFRATYHDELRAIFPSTTATVLTSQATGRWPCEHGIPGWFTYLPERGLTILPLPFVERFEGRPLKSLGIGLKDVVGPPGVMQRFVRPHRTYLPSGFVRSTYSTWARSYGQGRGYRDLRVAVSRLAQFARGRGSATYSYLYIPDVDHLSHRHGWSSEVVHDAVCSIDNALSQLRDELPQSARLAVTADHGQIVIPKTHRYQLSNERGGDLLELLMAPPTGEPRTPVFHTKPGAERVFSDRFHRVYGDCFVLLETEALERLSLYGPGPLSHTMRDRLGQFVGIAREAAIIEYVPPNAESLGFSGFHGGLTAAEMQVPLFLS